MDKSFGQTYEYKNNNGEDVSVKAENPYWAITHFRDASCQYFYIINTTTSKFEKACNQALNDFTANAMDIRQTDTSVLVCKDAQIAEQLQLNNYNHEKDIVKMYFGDVNAEEYKFRENIPAIMNLWRDEAGQFVTADAPIAVRFSPAKPEV